MTNQRDEDKFLEELADAILDGRLTTGAPDEGADAEQRAALREAEILARIADLHQRLPADDTALNGSVETGSVPLSWGRLTILEELGRGAFGAVYRARDPRLDRDVALKLLWPSGGDPDRFIASLVEEGRLLARIHHPNVVTIYDANVIDGRVGLTMEFVRGQTLGQEFQARGSFTSREVIAVGTEIAQALAAVHEAGLLHRDVKTQNVMRRPDGRLVLMDFGAGRPADGGTGEDAAITGTPLYLAPEVLNHQRATVQSDIYSLGVLLFYLLTGAYPVSGNTIRELRDAHRSGRRKTLAELRPDVSPALAAAIERAFTPTPSDRWASASDLARALAALDDPARSIWKPRFAVLLVTVALLGAAIAASVLLRRPEPDEGTVTLRQLMAPDDVYTFGRVSYDGKYLPYSGGFGSQLMVRNLLTGEDRSVFRQVPTEDGIIETAVVSRDGARIAYSWETEAARELRIIDFTGNNQRVILRDETPGAGFVPGAVIAPIDWTPDGSQILALRTRIADSHDIVLVDIRDGTVRTLKSGLPWPVSMSLSHDGRFVAFDHPEAAAGQARDISIITTAAAEEYRLFTHAAQDALPVWLPGDRGVMFTSDRSGTFGLWAVPLRQGRPAGPPEMIRKDIGLIGGMSLADEGTLVHLLDNGNVDVHVANFDVERGVVPGSTTPAATTYLGSNLDPDWSPDGRLAYVSRRRAMVPRAQALVVRSLTDGTERLLWPDLQGFTEPRWSPDGRRIIVRGNDIRGRRGPWLIDATTGAVTDRVGGPRFAALEWTRDSQALFVVTENRVVGKFDLASRQVQEIYRDPRGRNLAGLAVSSDQQWLAITVLEKEVFSIEILRATGGPARDIFRTTRPDVFMLQDWTRDGTSVLITRGQDHGSDFIRGDWSVWSVPVAGGSPRPLNLTAPRLRGVRVSPDGSRLAYRVGDPGWDQWVMRNFLP